MRLPLPQLLTLAAAALVAVALVLRWGMMQWSDRGFYGAIIAALLLLFLVRQRRAPQP